MLRAPTGAGKTTRVPPAVLDAGLAGGGSIVVLQPRRLTARACARRIAFERGVTLGGEVGYQVRFDRCMGPKTRIRIVTEGIFLRMLQDDPFLESVAAVVFDEFHERSLNSDLALAMVRRVQETVRPELKIVVMSATLAAEPIARWLGDCPVVESRGRLHPVEIRYLEDLRQRHGRRARGRRRGADPRSHAGRRARLSAGRGRDPPDGAAAGTAGRRAEPGRAAALRRPAGREAGRSPRARSAAARSSCRRTSRKPRSPSKASRRWSIRGLARSLFFDPHVGMDRLQLDADLAGLGRSAGGPRRPHAAGRLPAAVGRADPSPAARGR